MPRRRERRRLLREHARTLDARDGPREARDLSLPDPDAGSTPTATRSASRSMPTVDPGAGIGDVRRRRPVSTSRRTPTSRLTGSHIRPQPGYGYDERRHVTVWGRGRGSPDGAAVTLAARSARGAGTRPRCRSSSTPSGRSASPGATSTPSRRERGTPVKPRLSLGWLASADDPPAVPERDDRAGRCSGSLIAAQPRRRSTSSPRS